MRLFSVTPWTKTLDKILGTNPHNNSTRYNLYNELLLQLRCNDLDYTIKASTCTTSKYYSYMFYADRNIRPCTILGYTFTTFPKSLIQTKTTKRTLHRIASCKRRRTLHWWWRWWSGLGPL